MIKHTLIRKSFKRDNEMTDLSDHNGLRKTPDSPVWNWKWKWIFKFHFPFWVKIKTTIDTQTLIQCSSCCVNEVSHTAVEDADSFRFMLIW